MQSLRWYYLISFQGRERDIILPLEYPLCHPFGVPKAKQNKTTALLAVEEGAPTWLQNVLSSP